jgi:hypothetical protein
LSVASCVTVNRGGADAGAGFVDVVPIVCALAVGAPIIVSAIAQACAASRHWFLYLCIDHLLPL